MLILNIVLMEIKTDPGIVSTNQYWRKHEHKKVNQIWGDFLMSLFKWSGTYLKKYLTEISLLNPLKGGEILRKGQFFVVVFLQVPWFLSPPFSIVENYKT